MGPFPECPFFCQGSPPLMKRTAILALGITVVVVILFQALVKSELATQAQLLIDLVYPGLGVEGLHDPTPEAAAEEPKLSKHTQPKIIEITSSAQCYIQGIEKVKFPTDVDSASLLVTGDVCAKPGLGSSVGCPAGNGQIQLQDGSCGCEPAERIIAIRTCLSFFKNASSSSK